MNQALNNEQEITQAILSLDAHLQAVPNDADALLRRGKLHWRLGHRAQAITDFRGALELDPNSPAKTALEMSNDILDFFNPDIFNP